MGEDHLLDCTEGEESLKITIFLGAGASCAEGAPLQTDIIKALLNKNDKNFKNINKFIKTVFDINTEINQFPSVEEVLGMIDLAMNKRDNINKNFNFASLPKIRTEFILGMAKIISDELEKNNNTNNTYHNQLIDRLKVRKIIMDTTFITTNYDILIDNALCDLNNAKNKEDGISLDYGIDFTNFDEENDWERPGENSVKLFKLHGSLNWLYCPTCNTLKLTQYQKGIIKLITEPNSSACQCKSCNTSSDSVIIAPTYLKDMSNLYLNIVWKKAEEALSQSEIIIFCGYSFPDADFHVKYMLKRAQLSSKANLKKVLVFNGDNKKTNSLEEQRYRRFFGNCLEYTQKSFQSFVENPIKYINET